MEQAQDLGDAQGKETKNSPELRSLQSSPYAAPITTGGGMAASLLPTSASWTVGDWGNGSRLGNHRPPPPKINIPSAQQTTIMTSQGSLQSSTSTVPDSSAWGLQRSASLKGTGVSFSDQPGSTIRRPRYLGEAATLDMAGNLMPLQEGAAGGVLEAADAIAQEPVAPISPFQSVVKIEAADEGGLSDESSQGAKYHKGLPKKEAGDYDSQLLSEEEQWRIRRRIANRDSARRVRHRRLEELGDMERKVRQMAAQNAQLARQAEEAAAERDSLLAQLSAMGTQVQEVQEENATLRQQKQILEQSLTALPLDSPREGEYAADAQGQASQPPLGTPSAFGKIAEEPFCFPEDLANDRPGSSLNLTQDKKMSEEVLRMFPSLSLSLPSRLDSMEFMNGLLEQGKPAGDA